MTVKEQLHRVVDDMCEEEAERVLRRIGSLRNEPFLRFVDAAPLDDEPISPEEEAGIAEVEADRAAGVPTIPFDDVKRKHA